MPFQPLKPVALLFAIMSNAAIGLGLPRCSLSKSLNPGLGIIPETRNISVTYKNTEIKDFSFHNINLQKRKIEPLPLQNS